MERLYKYNGEPLELIDNSPESFGAIGDGVADDSVAFQSALDNLNHIECNPDSVYKITQTLRTGADRVIDLNGCTILSTVKHLLFNFQSDSTFTGYSGNGNITIRNGKIIGGALSLAHGENILLENVMFSACLNDHFLEVCACKNYQIKGCSFIGMENVQTSVQEYINIDPCTSSAFPWLPSGSAFYDGAKNTDLTIEGCVFGLGGGNYAYGYNAVGVHGVAGNGTNHGIRITGCRITGFTGCGIRANDMEDVFIADNNIRVAGDGVRVGDVGDVDGIVIMDNYITAGGQLIALTEGRYTNLTASGNVTQGDTQQ